MMFETEVAKASQEVQEHHHMRLYKAIDRLRDTQQRLRAFYNDVTGAPSPLQGKPEKTSLPATLALSEVLQHSPNEIDELVSEIRATIEDLRNALYS